MLTLLPGDRASSGDPEQASPFIIALNGAPAPSRALGLDHHSWHGVQRIETKLAGRKRRTVAPNPFDQRRGRHRRSAALVPLHEIDHHLGRNFTHAFAVVANARQHRVRTRQKQIGETDVATRRDTEFTQHLAHR